MGKTLLIVTPTIGRSPHFGEMVESIARLELPYIHFIVCPEVARERLEKRCPAAFVFAEKPGTSGIYDALNQAMLKACEKKWEWMTYINDDDLISPGIATCWRDAEPGDDLCYGHVNKLDEEGEDIEPISILRTERHLLSLAAVGISGFNQQGTLIRRRLWEAVGPFDTDFKICADFDWFVRAILAGAKCRYFPTVTGAFRIRKGQISQDVARELEEKVLIGRKNCLKRFKPKSSQAKRLFRIQNLRTYLRRLLRGKFYTSHQMLAGEKQR